MKELSIEEKAKAYDKAFKIAQELYNNPNSSKVGKCYVRTVFPELKESEDERIRKSLITYFQRFPYDSIESAGTNAKEAIFWLEKQSTDMSSFPKEQQKFMQKYVSLDKITLIKLLAERDANNAEIIESFEKQGEQKTFDYENANIQQKDFAPRQEPKFKVGDWIVFNGLVLFIKEVIQGYYRTISVGGTLTNSYDWDIDNAARLWTIKDAKDGDVLAEDSCIFIIQKLGDNNTTAKTYYTLYFDGDFDDGSMLYFDIDSTKPATKEQRDTLFTKMKEAGYEWDAEKKKKLKKIEQKPTWNEDETVFFNDFRQSDKDENV